MKRLLLLAIIFCSTSINAQEFDQHLFQTWYLVQNYETEGNQEYIVTDIEPEIVPIITFYDNLTFYGIGACNGFSGTIGHDNYNYPVVTSFLPSLSVCDDTIHNSFESMYFDFLGGLFLENLGFFSYDITPSADGLGLELTMHSPIFNGLIFRNYLLSTSEKQLQDIKLTFNPEHTKLYVNDSSNSIDNIKIYNTYGQSIKSISNNFNTIDIATLATGIYLVKIETNLGTVTKKIIKK
ncbi:T9SS type A sorting domain-containing protein [Pontimicrobium sp. IMCC45349]|uniref:T9SS type A sorting domain-containing protein n=1 Tax=Pontimicrobium sp. IMCC45349 TaxID=3391574 RepID=UPI0039A22A48